MKKVQSGDLTEGTVIITDNQTSGKGQRGNKWEAEPGMNLTFSVVLKPEFLSLSRQFHLNIITSLAVSDVLTNFSLQKVKIKWPNDIFFQNNKVSGILIENVVLGKNITTSIVGVGINVNQEVFSYPNATSLKNILLKKVSLEEVLHDFLKTFEKYYFSLKQGKDGQLTKLYINNLYRYNEVHSFRSAGRTFNGTIIDIDEWGRLIINTPEGEKAFAFKEVEYIT